MNISSFLLLLAAISILFFTGWVALPLIFFAFFPDSIRSWFLTDSESLNIQNANLLPMETVAELTKLGFVWLGVRVEKLPLWGVKLPAIALAHPQSHTYASVLLLAQKKPVGVYFFTPFKKGGMVFTRNQTHQPEFNSASESVKNMAGLPLSQVFGAHLSRLNANNRSETDYFDVMNLDDRHAAAILFYKSAYGRKQALKYIKTRQVRNFMIAVGFFIVFMVFWVRFLK